MKKRTVLALLLCLLAAACRAEPQAIIETVVVESTVEKPVTVQVTRQVEVTRQVQVTVETIREVEVTREVPIEVTRLVEVTITPSLEPAATAVTAPAAVATSQSAAAAPTSDVASQLLQSAQTTAENVGRVTDLMANVCRTGMSGGLGKLNCNELVRLSDAIVSAPAYEVTGSAQPVQDAYGQYRWAINIFADGNISLLVNDCRTQHAGETETEVSGGTGCDLSSQMQEPRNALNSAISTLQAILGQ